MGSKVEIELVGNDYKVTRVNSSGKVSDASTFHADAALPDDAAIRAIAKAAKGYGSLRVAHLSAIGALFAGIATGYCGTGDKATGKVPKEYKDAVRDAEMAYFSAAIKAGNVPGMKRDSDDKAIREWVSAVRADKNYEGVKGVATRFYLFCGQRCVTPSGHVVPVPVMSAMLVQALDIKPDDNSMAGKLRKMLDDVAGLSDKVPDSGNSPLTAAIVECRALLAALESELTKRQEINAMKPAQIAQPTARDAKSATRRAIAAAKGAKPAEASAADKPAEASAA